MLLTFCQAASLPCASAASQNPPAKQADSSPKSNATEDWNKEYDTALELGKARNFAAAVPILRKLLALPGIAKDAGAKALMQMDLAEDLYQLQKYDEALDLFYSAGDVLLKQEEHYKKEIVEVLEMLSRTSRHLGNAADAEGYGIKSLNMCGKIYGNDSVQYAYNLRNMGKLYLGLYRYLDAEDVMRRSLAIFEKKGDIDDDQLAGCYGYLYEALVEQGKTSEASKVLVQLAPLEKKLGSTFHFDVDKTSQGEVKYDRFMRVLQYSLKKAWIVPKNAEPGRAIAFFKIHMDGKISDLKIDCPSGDPVYDKSCINAIEAAFAHPLFPPKGALDSIDISFTFDQNLLGGSELSGKQSHTRFDPIAVALKLIDKHNYREAKAILSQPDLANSVKANTALSRISNEIYQGAEGEKYARKAIELDPHNIDAKLQCAMSLIIQLKYAEAVEIDEAILKLKPEPSLERETRREIIVLNYDLKNGGSVFRAERLIKQRKINEAMHMLEKLKAQDPKDSEVEYALSEAYTQLGKTAEALKHIKTAVLLDPRDFSYLIKESWLEQRLGHAKASLDILHDVLKKDPPAPVLAYVKELLGNEEVTSGMQTIPNDMAKDYLQEFAGNNLRRWKLGPDKTLNVYIASGDYVPGYRDEFKGYVVDALRKWSEAFQGKVNFKQVSNPDTADIAILFASEKDNASHAAEGGRTLIIGGGTHIVGALIILETEFGGSTEEAFRLCCVHEIGHALGLGHSKSDKDIMYFVITERPPAITQRDKNTLEHLYEDGIKFPEWELVDEAGLSHLEKFEPRLAIPELEKALSISPDKNSIEEHLSRAYMMAIYENLASHTLGDSHELIAKAEHDAHKEETEKHVQELKKILEMIDSLSETDRKIVLEIIKDHAKWPPNGTKH